MTAPPLPTFIPQDAWYTLTTGNINPSEADSVPDITYLHPSSTPQGPVDGLVGSLDGAVIYLAGLASELDGGQKWLMWRAASMQVDDGVNTFCPFADATKPGRWINTGTPQSGPGAITTVQGVVAGADGEIASAVTQFITVFVKVRIAPLPMNLALPGSTFLGQQITVKDAEGDAGTYPITVGAPSIDGSPTDVLGTDYQERTYTWNGTEWSMS